MQINVSSSLAVLKWLEPPTNLPAAYQQQLFKLSPRWHLGIAALLNILSLAVPVMMLQVYDRIIPRQAFGTLSMLITGVLIALVFDAGLRLARAWLSGWAAASHEHVASCAALERFAHAPLDAFSDNTLGEHMQNFSALDRLREFYSGQSLTALVDMPFAALFLVLVAYMGGILVIIPLLLLLGFVLFSRPAGNWLKKTIEERAHADDRKAGYMISVLGGIHTVKSFGMEMPLLRHFEDHQKSVTEGSYRVALATGNAATLSALFSQLSLVVTAAAGSLMVLDGQLSVGGLSACTMLVGRALQPVQRVLGTWLRMQDLEISRKQADMLMSLPMQERQSGPLPAPRGMLRAHNVSFSYKESSFALRDVSLELDHGQVVAISGEKGSGKSTLLQLMAGVLVPEKGVIRIDGFDTTVRSISEKVRHVGYLPQQGVMFRGSILENLTGFMNDDASISAAKEAAADLGLDSAVDVLTHGYETILSDGAADPVPPGVKQRIALARVLRHKPALLLFDDADKALDKEGYNRLFRLLGRLKGNCSMVMVSHDQNLLSFADRFYILNKGMLRESTRHAAQTIALLATNMGGMNVD